MSNCSMCRFITNSLTLIFYMGLVIVAYLSINAIVSITANIVTLVLFSLILLMGLAIVATWVPIFVKYMAKELIICDRCL